MLKPLISVIICTYNRERLLKHCLQSLSNQTISKSLYEVIIINNNSTDNTQIVVEDYLKSQSNFRAVIETKQGLSNARNRGWQEAEGRYIAYIDDDAKATPKWCENILNAFTVIKPEPSAVGGQIYPWYEVTPPDWFENHFEIRSWGTKAGFLEPNSSRYYFSGSNMAFPRRVFELYGGFDCNYGMFGNKMRMADDTEYFLRLSKIEPRFWYDPNIKVFHWTPIRNMKIKYRFYRAYTGGKAQAIMYNRKILSLKYLKEWGSFFLFLIKVPLILIKSRKILKTKYVKLLEAFGFRIGSLIGRKC